jgi:anti-anti-sigma factor
MPILSFMNEPGLTYSSSPGKQAGTLIVRLDGPLTLSSLFDFQEEFRALKPPVLILDLAACPYMDSAGLGLVMNKYVSAENSRRKFFLAGINTRIEALIELTKVNRVLKVFPTPEAAEDAAWIAEGVLRRP